MFPGLNLKKSRAQYNMYGREQGSTDLAGNQFFSISFFFVWRRDKYDRVHERTN